MLLDGALLKLERAAQICDVITSAAMNFIEGELSDGLQFDEPDLMKNGWHTLTVGPMPKADPMLGVILGEFVHNVRSALDQMVWSLVLAAGGKPGSHTHFPVTESRTSGAVLMRAAGRLTLDTRARLRWLLRAVTPPHGGEVHLDLGQVTEANAAGVAILLVQAGSCRATGGRLRVVATDRAVHDVLVTVGASDLVLATEPSTEVS